MVRVVVIDLTECAGDENVLFLSPSVLAAVALVPALELAASEAAVSAVVERVGALDLACAWLSWEAKMEFLLCERELCRDRGEERWPTPQVSALPDNG